MVCLLRTRYRDALRSRKGWVNGTKGLNTPMGHLIYDGALYEFEDRLLAHVKMVVQLKLTKMECFFLTWHPHCQADSEMSVWISPRSPLAFHFSGSREPPLSKSWVVALNAISHTPRGLVVISEKDAIRYLRENPGVR